MEIKKATEKDIDNLMTIRLEMLREVNGLSDSYEYDYSDSSVTEKTVVESGNCKDIISFSKDLVRYYNDYCKNSRLYHYNNIFRILIESEQSKSKSIADCADSHRLRSMYGNIIEAQTVEYFECVIDNCAVEKLSGKILL